MLQHSIEKSHLKIIIMFGIFGLSPYTYHIYPQKNINRLKLILKIFLSVIRKLHATFMKYQQPQSIMIFRIFILVHFSLFYTFNSMLLIHLLLQAFEISIAKYISLQRQATFFNQSTFLRYFIFRNIKKTKSNTIKNMR